MTLNIISLSMEYHYVNCRDFNTILSVIKLSVVILNVVMVNVAMVNVVMMNVYMQIVVMLSVVVPLQWPYFKNVFICKCC